MSISEDYYYGPKIVQIKRIHNTVANAISHLDFGLVKDNKANWMMFTKCRCHCPIHSTGAESTQDHQKQINMVQQRKYNLSLTEKEIAQAQKNDAVLKKLNKTDNYTTQLVEDT